MQNDVASVAGGSQAAIHPVGRIALLIRSVKSAFALLLEKVTKPRLAPDTSREAMKDYRHETNDQRHGRKRLSQPQ